MNGDGKRIGLPLPECALPAVQFFVSQLILLGILDAGGVLQERPEASRDSGAVEVVVMGAPFGR